VGRILLTDKFVAGVKPQATEVAYADEQVRGLTLRSFPSGERSWVYRYRFNGDRPKLPLGSYPAVTLAAARGRALEAATALAAGIDPRGASAGEMTVTALVESYLAKHAVKLRSAKAIERRLRKNVVPVIGNVKLSALHRRDCTRVVDTVMERGRETEACRVYQDLRAMLRWAVSRGDLDHAPSEGMRAPAKLEARERVLDDGEIKALLAALAGAFPRSISVQRVLRLCLFSLQRVGEVAGMAKAELDLKAGTWIIPAARAKNKRDHLVPLCPLARAVIEEALADSGASAFVFPGEGRADGPLPAHAVNTSLRRAFAPSELHPHGRIPTGYFVPHDLRRSGATMLGQLGVPDNVIGAVLNHVSTTRATVTSKHYNLWKYQPEKAAALRLWEERVAAIVAGNAAEIVPMFGRPA
jgi:integrase